MSAANTDSTPRERLPEAPPLQPAQNRETNGDTAARRPELRQAAAFAGPRALPTVNEVSAELQRQSYEWTTAVRLLEQSEHALICAELDRHQASEELERIVPVVNETAKQLTAAVDASRPGQPLSNMRELFAAHGKALEQLETAAVGLSNCYLRYRSAWDEYARNVANAQRLRGDQPRLNGVRA